MDTHYPWIKLSIAIALGTGFWLAPTLLPMPKIAQGFSLTCAICAAAGATRLAAPLITQESHQRAQEGMRIKLLQRALTMQTLAEERALDAHYHAEVSRMTVEELERFQGAETTVSTSQLPTSPQLVAAVRKLAASGVSRTAIVEDVLGMKGRQFNAGLELVNEILSVQ